MNKEWLKLIVVSSLLIVYITLDILFFIKKEKPIIQEIVFINPKPGIHIIKTPMDRKYIQVKIGNYTAGTFTVSLEMNNFKEREETE